jgi:hypothetical protein
MKREKTGFKPELKSPSASSQSAKKSNGTSDSQRRNSNPIEAGETGEFDSQKVGPNPFGELAWTFLNDRRCKDIQKTLGSLFTSPNFSDPYENHLRVAALLARKPFAAKALAITLVAYDNDWGEPCRLYGSKANWKKVPMTKSHLNELNVFGYPISKTVEEYLDIGSCLNPKCNRFMNEHKWEASSSTINDCSIKQTIWRNALAKGIARLLCVEGNKRVHSLAWRAATIGEPELEEWSAWIEI